MPSAVTREQAKPATIGAFGSRTVMLPGSTFSGVSTPVEFRICGIEGEPGPSPGQNFLDNITLEFTVIRQSVPVVQPSGLIALASILLALGLAALAMGRRR